MCRLFGLHAGTNVVTAKFWLLDAPDNLAAQSRKNPDGTGLGVFDGQGRPGTTSDSLPRAANFPAMSRVAALPPRGHQRPADRRAISVPLTTVIKGVSWSLADPCSAR